MFVCALCVPALLNIGAAASHCDSHSGCAPLAVRFEHAWMVYALSAHYVALISVHAELSFQCSRLFLEPVKHLPGTDRARAVKGVIAVAKLRRQGVLEYATGGGRLVAVMGQSATDPTRQPHPLRRRLSFVSRGGTWPRCVAWHARRCSVQCSTV
jgi:hypothetical protein